MLMFITKLDICIVNCYYRYLYYHRRAPNGSEIEICEDLLFDTPTFDRITKDRSAKFVDMLSAIGGTMGLLTGFSIISGVEIAYFAIKIIVNLVQNKKHSPAL